MRLECDPPFRPGWLVTKIRPPELAAVIIVKGSFRLRPDAPADPAEKPESVTGDVPNGEEEPSSLRYASDFAPFKPRMDLLLAGSCHAPGGKPIQVCRVLFGVGAWAKALNVIGDREAKRGLLGYAPPEPKPFTRMPLTYENAFGGPGHAQNPVGKGHEAVVVPDGSKVLRLPNVEYGGQSILDSTGRPASAGFGPLPATWLPRRSKAGTYGAKWLKERWPWLPEDLDWAYFNAAPADQQLPGCLRGDEEIRFENLHPARPQYASRLPGLRPRCFLHEENRGQWNFREVSLKLDTLWVCPEEERLVLVWRGHAAVQDIKLRNVRHLYVASERMADRPRSAEEHRKRLNEILPAPYRFEPIPEPAPKTEEPPPPEPTPEEEVAATQKLLAEFEAQVKKEIDGAKAQMVAAGAPPSALSPPHPPALPPAAALEAMRAEAQSAAQRYGSQLPPETLQQLQTFQPPEASAPPDEEEKEAVPWTRRTVAKAVHFGRDLRDQELSGLDLSGLDLSGARMAKARLSKTKLAKTRLADADLSGASLRDADLSEADLSRARLDDSDFTRAKMAGVVAMGASVKGADFSRADLSGAVLDDVRGRGASFRGAKASKARFRGAKLPVAGFEEAELAESDFRNTELSGATFHEAKAPGILMEGADLSKLHAGKGPNFEGGNFKSVRADESTWDGAKLDRADFTGAMLTRSDFSEASLRGAVFVRSPMRKARFLDAVLEGAKLLQCNLCSASFERADLTGADVTGSNFYNAEFWDAKIDGMKSPQANFDATKLAGRS